jgi:hypothetical protein
MKDSFGESYGFWVETAPPISLGRAHMEDFPVR